MKLHKQLVGQRIARILTACSCIIFMCSCCGRCPAAAVAASAIPTCCEVSASKVVLGLSQCCPGLTKHLLCKAGTLIGLKPVPKPCLAGGQWLDWQMPAAVLQQSSSVMLQLAVAQPVVLNCVLVKASFQTA